MINLQRLPVERLQPAPYNPRVALVPGSPAYRRLERSLREFDLVQPIVWNEATGHVVAGHQRLEILRRQGVTDVDVAVVNLPLAREKALNVALNNTQVGSDWDADKLVSLLKDLHDLPDFDATLTGFDEADLRDLLLAPAEELDDEAVDEGPPLVRVTVEIPQDQWHEVHPALDQLVADHNLRLHVQLPS